MDWIRNLNRALNYIENRLEEDIMPDDVAKVANSSKFHFLRVFNILTDKTLGEYIRERRISVATKDILSGKFKVIDVAYKYRYETPESFSKAFKRYHGVTPSQAIKSGTDLNSSPPLYFSIQVKGEEQVKYTIEKKSSFKVAGPSIDVTSKNGENYAVIPEFWQKTMVTDDYKKLTEQSGDLGTMGICYNFDPSTENFSYMIGIEGEKVNGVDFKTTEIPDLTWAIFEGKGELPGAIQDLWKKIFNEWFPATKYEHDSGPEIEIYKKDSFEIWIPIK